MVHKNHIIMCKVMEWILNDLVTSGH